MGTSAMPLHDRVREVTGRLARGPGFIEGEAGDLGQDVDAPGGSPIW